MKRENIVFLIVLFCSIFAICAWSPSAADYAACITAVKGKSYDDCYTGINKCYDALLRKCTSENPNDSDARNSCKNEVLLKWATVRNNCPYE